MPSDKLLAYNQKLIELHFIQSQVMRLGDALLREGGYENIEEEFVSETMDVPKDAMRTNHGNTDVINTQIKKLCALDKLLKAEKEPGNDTGWRKVAKLPTFRDRVILIKAIRQSTGLLLDEANAAATAIHEGAKI